jgi:hypothetical protein
MNKKIKSLLVAGLLVVGMGGNAFAAGESELPTTSTSTITNPKFEDGKRVVELQGGLIVVEMTEKENGEYDIVVKWKEESIKILGVKSYYENGSIDHTNYFEELYHCNTLGKEGEFVFGKVLGGGEGFSGPLGKLVKVEVTFENLTKGDEPVVPPVTPPEEEIVDPETGDAGMMIGVVSVAVASLGLVVVNKKKGE